MTALQIIKELKKHKVLPRLDGSNLKLIGETRNLSPEFIGQIKASKDEVILLLKDSMDQFSFTPIPAVPQQESYPASNAQKRLWVLSQFEGGSAAYNIVTGFLLTGTVVAEKLNKAFRAAIRRHESLRTIFRVKDGEPMQVVLPEIPFEIGFEDISGRDDKRAFLKAVLEGPANWKFDLEKGPLLRVLLFKMSEEESALIFGVHHIISDGWSVGVLVREVMQYYESFCRNMPVVPEPLRIHYKEYTSWQSERMNENRSGKARDFWKSQFPAPVEPLHLPTDFPRPASRTFEGAVTKRYFADDLYSDILEFCRKNHVTLFNFFRSTLTVLLNKFSIQQDIVIGTPVSGRNHVDLENQFGLYVNTLPLRAHVEPGDSFLEFLRQIADSSVKAFEFQDYPLDGIIDALQVKRDAGRNPLFDVMMVLQQTSRGEGGMPVNKQYGFELNLLDKFLYASGQGEEEQRPSKLDLNFNFSVDPGNRFYLEIEYATGLFKRDRILQLFDAYLYIIRQILTDPTMLIGSIEITGPEEKQRILQVFNSPVDNIEEYAITELLANAFEQYKDQPAIVAGNNTLTYGQLDAQCHALAAALTGLLGRDGLFDQDDLTGQEGPVSPGSAPFVALLMDRSPRMIVAILGIIRAGAAYVPVDPVYPASRVEYILGDAQPEILLVDDKGMEKVPAQYKGRVVHIDALFMQSAAGVGAPRTDRREQTAYLIYTSGSTGKPKGVEICHRNTIAFLKWARQEFAATPFDLLYATTSYCFDLSVFEIFFPLTMGKTIRLLGSALEIPVNIRSDKNIMINTVPSVVRNLLSEGMDWTNVTALNMAGEPIPKKIMAELDCTRMEVRNLYGPSEATTYSTIYRFAGNGQVDPIPVGAPVGYTQLYILDPQRHLLPVGVEGEIYLSGQAIAKGYFSKQELTAAKFLDNPFAPAWPMYRTGDIGRWTACGQVEFAGRLDDQVKVRGYRIELGEIEFVLERHDLLDQAVAVVREIDGDNHVVAYWAGPDTLDASTLKAYATQYLPSYMVPAYWVHLPEIPLNSNGKVDKKQLPDPLVGLVREDSIVKPANELQRRLMALWSETLPVTEFGITHHFFDIGGNSLKATKLRSLIARDLERDLTLNEIFLFPTIEKQAEILRDKPVIPAMPIREIATQPHYPISFAQERLWILTSFEEASKAYNMPVAFRVQGTLYVDKLEAAFRQVIARHEILRTVFAVEGEHAVQVIGGPEEIEFSIREITFDRCLTPIEEAAFLQRQWQLPFDLARGPLLHCFLLKTADITILSINIHHIISDGWSIIALFEQLMESYKDIISGGSGQLTPLPFQYKDFAAWQRERLTGDRLEQQRAFWTDIFRDEIPVLELPTDFFRPEVRTYQAATVETLLPAHIMQKIDHLARDCGASLLMVLLAGVKVLLKKYANQDDIVVGVPVAGREHHQLEDQIGFYVNTLAIRTKMTGDLPFHTLLGQIKEQVLNAFEYQSYPFELLLEELKIKRDLSRSPLFDVLVVLQNLEGMDNASCKQVTADLRLDRISLPVGMAKYDLTFSFMETEDGMMLELEYNTSLFKEGTIRQMTSHLATLFGQVAAHNEIALQDIRLLDRNEYEILASKADRTKAPYDKAATLVSLFEESVRAYPDNIALVDGDKQITYAELDRKSGQLARVLINTYNVQADDLVLLHFDRNEWMLIAILAVLKAGGAYVPIDPTYPETRSNYIIGDTQSRLMLYDTAPGDEVRQNWPGITFLNIAGHDFSGETAIADIRQEQLAYVIYTSGTTGNPKGVLIEHGNVTRLLFSEGHPYDFGPTDRWPLFHSYCFDVSVWEMYGAFLNGGTLVIVPREIARDSIAFYDFLGRERITVLNQTPTAFRSLVQNNARRFFKTPVNTIRYVIFAGEALMPEILREWNQAMPDCKNINMYGITETTVHVTFKEITTADIEENKSNVGLPLPTLSCYILDRDLQQVPVGVIGELCVGGAGVARGYLNKPELTAARFIESPSGGGRLYRSGDFARILPSGDIEYIGRKDDQVKIRGHRIETPEVEAAIIRQVGVRDAVVLPLKGSNGDYDLVAYFIPDGDLSAHALRNGLTRVLPAYMVPSYLIPLTEFPLNRNGKLDKKELPLPQEALESQVEHVSARNDLDNRLIGIWEEILGRTGIGIMDNFFDLGGHSLKATRVIAKIHEMFGVKIDMKSLFVEPTITHLSDYIETIQWMDHNIEVVPEGVEETIF